MNHVRLIPSDGDQDVVVTDVRSQVEVRAARVDLSDG